MFDTDTFIHLIEDHPIIWDMGHKKHHDRNELAAAWNEIGTAMHPDAGEELGAKSKS